VRETVACAASTPYGRSSPARTTLRLLTMPYSFQSPRPSKRDSDRVSAATTGSPERSVKPSCESLETLNVPAHVAGLPAEAGAQEERFAVGQVLQDLGVLDVERGGDDCESLVHELRHGQARERALAELGEGLLRASRRLEALFFADGPGSHDLR